jgi:hypothetical protein
VVVLGGKALWLLASAMKGVRASQMMRRISNVFLCTDKYEIYFFYLQSASVNERITATIVTTSVNSKLHTNYELLPVVPHAVYIGILLSYKQYIMMI